MSECSGCAYWGQSALSVCRKTLPRGPSEGTSASTLDGELEQTACVCTHTHTAASAMQHGFPLYHIHSNICHGSDSVATAKKEIALWFKPEELCDWSKTSDQWIYES